MAAVAQGNVLWVDAIAIILTNRKRIPIQCIGIHASSFDIKIETEVTQDHTHGC